MERYVSGFLFRPGCRSTVILLKKIKPDFLRDQWTGVGGHLEDGETPLEGMIREFEEETGVRIEDWEHFCTLKGKGFELDWFLSENEKYFELSENKIFVAEWDGKVFTNDVGEQISEWDIDDIPNIQLSNNAQWLIPMALSIRKDRARAFHIQELY